MEDISIKQKYNKKFRVFGLKLAYYRKRSGYTQEEFANALGMSWSFIAQIESNSIKKPRGVSLGTLFHMAETLKIPASKLLEDD